MFHQQDLEAVILKYEKWHVAVSVSIHQHQEKHLIIFRYWHNSRTILILEPCDTGVCTGSYLFKKHKKTSSALHFLAMHEAISENLYFFVFFKGA